MPLLVSLIGTTDEYVSPADSMDIGGRHNAVFLEVPRTAHIEILRIAAEGPRKEPDVAVRMLRRELFAAALTGSKDDLACHEFYINPDDIDDYVDPLDLPAIEQIEQINKINHVVLIVHGIRDDGFWTKRVARHVKKLGDRTVVRAASPSYGFFSALQFMWPPARHDGAKWLLDQYALVRSHFPYATRVSFVGHSNGTWLCKRALQLCRTVHLERIVFAGSVVRTDHDWATLDDRYGSVLNVYAKDDWVVAFLPGLMERFGWRTLDVGGAGNRGFGLPAHGVTNLGPVKGGHGAALKEAWWPKLAAFVVDGSVPSVFNSDLDRSSLSKRALKWIRTIIVTLGGLAIVAFIIDLLMVFLGPWQGGGLSFALLSIAFYRLLRFY